MLMTRQCFADVEKYIGTIFSPSSNLEYFCAQNNINNNIFLSKFLCAQHNNNKKLNSKYLSAQNNMNNSLPFKFRVFLCTN